MKHTLITFILGATCGAFGFYYFTSPAGKASAHNAVHTAATAAHGAIASGEAATN